MTVSIPDLCRPGGPFAGHVQWVTAFEQTGATLVELATHGGLSRGLRAVLAHHVFFHANRAGLSREDQHALPHIAREESWVRVTTSRQQPENPPHR